LLTTKLNPIRITLQDFSKIYDSQVNKTDSTGKPGEFLTFYATWMRSDVYKVPSGFIRLEPYPALQSATIHGIFFSNPFRDSENIENVLRLYLQEHPDFTHLECHVPKNRKGLRRFVASIAHSSCYRGDKWIFIYDRREEIDL
jgi:hypothetical protein